MSAREELAQSIATNLDRMFGQRDFGPATQDYELADALLAEGWGKLADAWDAGFKQGGPMHDEHYGEPDKHTINPYRPQS